MSTCVSQRKAGGAITEAENYDLRTKAEILLEKAKKHEAGKIPVRVDSKTVIFIKPDKDPAEAVARFISQVQKSRNKF